MTPKEKAKQLFEKYFIEISGVAYNPIDVANYKHSFSLPIRITKQCAIIAVDEIIEVIDDFEFSNHGKIGNNYGQKFWYEVKEELEKM